MRNNAILKRNPTKLYYISKYLIANNGVGTRIILSPKIIITQN